ncbi:MAG: phage major capsid protein [Corynebacterium variabile]|uniref:phage major capsid protein n=1 Tax=Corynebacterium variabile TaxID=1727 RepID=UPI00264A4073|nr:phage major capsid protein [Corynebacterium variabile]MDN6537104.1 phage major capsid protein [Corynebacterium variabile]
MVNSTTSANQLIQDQVSTMLVEPLQAASVVLAAGPTIFNSSEPLRIPTLTDFPGVGWVGENQEIPSDGEATFGEIALMPTDRKSIKRIVRVSNELIRQAKQGVSTILQTKLVAAVADALDDALLAGDGADKSVTGILNQPGVTTAPMSTTDTDPFLDALALAASMEVTPNRFILNGTDFYNLRKLKDNNGRYILQGGPAEGAPYTLFEVPVTATNKLPAGKGVLADMSQIAVVRDIDPQVTGVKVRDAEVDQVCIRVTTRYDLGLLRPEGVILLDGAAGAGE